MNTTVFLVLSFGLFLFSFYLQRKSRTSKGSSLVYLLFSAVFVIFLTLYGVAHFFTGEGINEAAIYHILYGLQGAGFSEYMLPIAASVTFPILVISGQTWLLLRNASVENRRVENTSSFLLILLAIMILPATRDLYHMGSNFIDVAGYRSQAARGNQDGEIDPSIAHGDVRNFYDFYSPPFIFREAEQTKNLVFIYAESLEQTYFDERIFPGLITELRELETNRIQFMNIDQVTGTGWTIGGMVASQCGIPLFTPLGSSGNSMSGMDRFLASATCLGDLLQQDGYQLAYYGGADIGFAGKGKFYASHGFNEVYGKAHLTPRLSDENQLSGWGLFDDSLFEFAFQHYVASSRSNNRFGLFLVTLDTHHPYGHPSQECKGKKYQDGYNPMLNAVVCSDYLISKFISRIFSSPWADQTVVVLVSDHLAMWNSATGSLKKGDRKNLFMIFDSGIDESIEVSDSGSMLDVAPTVLPFLGYGGQIGLGRNLLSDDANRQRDVAYIQGSLHAWRQPIAEFWNFPKLESELTIDVENRLFEIDGVQFDIPLFVEFDRELATIVRFPDATGRVPKTASDYVSDMETEKSFFLVDECRNFKSLELALGEDGFCLITGNGAGQVGIYSKLSGKKQFSAEEVALMFGYRSNS